MNGIELGQGSQLGEAYLAIQRMALDLRRRGVVLAVCSKNDETNARLAFKVHPEMLLKEEDIAVFSANWNDKASNLEAIAEALAMTPASLVFLDDNPAEREIVRRELPTVAVPEVPESEPALWPLIISAAGYFETVQFTSARSGTGRASMRITRNAPTVSSKSRDLKSYLTDLQMEMEVSSSLFRGHRLRISQLINKSNQFNLTSRRYTDEQVQAMEADPACACFAARLKDRFGDNGIVSVVICEERDAFWHIDTWLMSCRVLARQVEQAFLNHIAESALQSR